MFKKICGLLLVLGCISASAVAETDNPETASWQSTLQTLQQKTSAKEYRYLIDQLLSPEYKKSAAAAQGKNNWEAVFISKEVNNLSFCLSCMDDPKITSDENTVRLCGRYNCHLVFIKIHDRYYLHDFGQQLNSM